MVPLAGLKRQALEVRVELDFWERHLFEKCSEIQRSTEIQDPKSELSWRFQKYFVLRL
jgi:hypothetical protein